MIYSQWTLGQGADSDDEVESKIPEPMRQKTAIQRIEKHQTEGQEKTQSHIDARAQSLIAVCHRRCENRSRQQRHRRAIQCPSEQIDQENTERGVQSRRKPDRGLVQGTG